MDLYADKRRRKVARRDVVSERSSLSLLPRGGAISRRVTGS
jgi:hypothetical protein